jgi:iron(III) transport system ATP-binding protein
LSGLLELDSIVKTYGTARAVDELNLDIAEREFVVLLGPSGCGKTTTLRMIAGFADPTAGEIRLEGRSISSASRVVPPERRDMGMMFQSYAVWPHMTVRQNVAYGLKIKKVPRRDLASRVDQALDTVRLAGYADRYPAELSGGQQQRVALARAMAVDPKILLMDEPLSNLDAKLREEMRGELHRLHASLGFTAVYVTHDQSEAMALADRIVVMREGRVQQIGSPTDLYLRPENAFVAGFLGRANLLPGVAGPEGTVAIGNRRLPCTSTRPLAPGAKVLGVVRPIGVDVVDDDEPDAADTLDGVVTDMLFLGETKEAVLRVPDLGTELSATFSPYIDAGIGTKLRCRLRGIVAVEADDHVPSHAGAVDPAELEAEPQAHAPART